MKSPGGELVRMGPKAIVQVQEEPSYVLGTSSSDLFPEEKITLLDEMISSG